jgi:peptidoglycan hydrolase-like protein with peptidoglycan-binding domain
MFKTSKFLVQAPLALALTLTFPIAITADQHKTANAEADAETATIQKAQKKLQKKGFYAGEIDGQVGPQTMSALKAYQREKGIPQTGALDARTLDELGIKTKRMASTTDADDGTLEKAGRKTEEGVRAGGEATGKGVRKAGKETKSAGEAVDDSVDKAGEVAGKGLEKGIEKTGDGLEGAIEGTGEGLKKAGGAVKDVFDKDDKASVEARAKYDTRQTVDETKAAQQKLAAMGYYNGQVDGVMGAETEAALKKYQEKNNLPQTGQLDAKTRAKLDLDKK